MQIRNNTLITECSAYDFKEMLERKKVKSWLKSVSAFANTEASSFFTTFYNLNWGKNERISGRKGKQSPQKVSCKRRKFGRKVRCKCENVRCKRQKFGDKVRREHRCP